MMEKVDEMGDWDWEPFADEDDVFASFKHAVKRETFEAAKWAIANSQAYFTEHEGKPVIRICDEGGQFSSFLSVHDAVVFGLMTEDGETIDTALVERLIVQIRKSAAAGPCAPDTP